jgi:Spy/CpxP family protein refolding chaperone
MKLPVSILTAALLAASSALYAQAGSDNAGASKGGEGKPPAARRFDCSKTQDPKGCEERRERVRATFDKARKACEGKSGEERRECMTKTLCADTKDPAQCEARMKAGAERRREMREACKDKKGDEQKACMREYRQSHPGSNKK